MTCVAIALWSLIWGAAGYFTVRVIQMRIERKRFEKALADRIIRNAEQAKNSMNTITNNRVVYNPFVGIL